MKEEEEKEGIQEEREVVLFCLFCFALLCFVYKGVQLCGWELGRCKICFTFPMKTLSLFSCTATAALPLLAKLFREREGVCEREKERKDRSNRGGRGGV